MASAAAAVKKSYSLEMRNSLAGSSWPASREAVRSRMGRMVVGADEDGDLVGRCPRGTSVDRTLAHSRGSRSSALSPAPIS